MSIKNIKQFFFLLSLMHVFASCSETYQEYLVDIDVNYSIYVENSQWDIKSFSLVEKTNTAQGDTSTFVLVKLDAIDNSFPYPKQLVAYLYFNQVNNDFETTSEISDFGLVDKVILNEIDLSYENVLYKFSIDKSKAFSPRLTIFDYDTRRKLISGTLEGALYDLNSSAERRVKISFQNIKLGKQYLSSDNE